MENFLEEETRMSMLMFWLSHLSLRRCTLHLSVSKVTSSYDTHSLVALEIE